MPRYIDADDVSRVLLNLRDRNIENDDMAFALDWAAQSISRLPTISPDDVRGAGEWEDAKQHGLCRCSVCKDCYIEKGYITQAKWRFCPSCGARMKGAEDGTTD